MTEKILILHGWEDDSSKGFIPELVKTLKDKGYSPIALDLPNTEKPKFEEWFAMADKEMEKLGNDVSIIGHSMGGLLALKLAEKYKVNKLVLVAPVGSKPSEKYFEQFKEKLDEEEMKIFRLYQNREIDLDKIKANSQKISFIFGKKDPWINEEIREYYSKNFEDKAKIVVYDNYGHMSEDEGVKKLPEVENLFEKSEAKPKEEKKAEDKEAKKKVEDKPSVKKEEAIALGRNLHISKKQGVYVCSFIKNKDIDFAISELNEVIKFRKAVPFKGEIPHRKGKGMMSGRYPVKAAGLFVTVLKGLKGNVIVNGLDLDKTKIYSASASWAARPARSGNRQAKRTNVILKAKEIIEVKRK